MQRKLGLPLLFSVAGLVVLATPQRKTVNQKVCDLAAVGLQKKLEAMWNQ